MVEAINEMMVVKSGTNYKNFSEIDLFLDEKASGNSYEPLNDSNIETDKLYEYKLARYRATLYRRDITVDLPVDEEIRQHVQVYEEKMNKEMERVTKN